MVSISTTRKLAPAQVSGTDVIYLANTQNMYESLTGRERHANLGKAGGKLARTPPLQPNRKGKRKREKWPCPANRQGDVEGDSVVTKQNAAALRQTI